MNRILIVAFALLGPAGWTSAEPADQKNLALADRVQARVATGDTNALNDLSTLPASYSCPALLAIYKNNRNDAAIRSKCAQRVVTVPGGEDYLVKLIKGRAANNDEFSRQEIAINCLVQNHNQTSVRILGRTLDEVDPKEMGPYVIRALAELNPPGSPNVPKNHPIDTEVLAQWQQWWNAHKGNYAADTPPN